MTTTKLQPSLKAINQSPEGRGFCNGNYRLLSNYPNEVTFNVQLGYNTFLHYHFLDVLKFTSVDDAKEYVTECGASEGTVEGKHYMSITKQEGVTFSPIGFYSIK